jgi:hypothetical protein
VKRELGLKARHRDIKEDQGSLVLRQTGPAYAMVFDAENEALRGKTLLNRVKKLLLLGLAWSDPLVDR